MQCPKKKDEVYSFVAFFFQNGITVLFIISTPHSRDVACNVPTGFSYRTPEIGSVGRGGKCGKCGKCGDSGIVGEWKR